MKTYVLTVSRTFPAYHVRAGEETGFVERVLNKSKIHTIRGNYELWRKRFDEIEAGRACLSIRYWSGTPYQTKQVEFARLTREDGIGIEEISINGIFSSCFIHRRDNGVSRGRHVELVDINLQENDGLTVADFEEWFKKQTCRNRLRLFTLHNSDTMTETLCRSAWKYLHSEFFNLPYASEFELMCESHNPIDIGNGLLYFALFNQVKAKKRDETPPELINRINAGLAQVKLDHEKPKVNFNNN